ncbi:YbjN domain-containing protein [Microcoleus sp. ARI1-B5]|uniref:YbjN domain-containing protein n=1 Tax=unclassified Microcoleus TaxID=2642155 RepID=UPI002FD48CE2
MNPNNEICQLHRDLKLCRSSHSPLSIHAINLCIIKQDNTLTECRLTFQVNWELYHRIDTEALFNLKSELRGSLSNGDFQPEGNIEIEATLQPELLPSLTENITTAEQTAAYLQNLSQEQPEHPLLSTENWFALHVKQQQESGATGYRTFWAYLPPSAISQENISQEQISAAMVNFFQDWADANLSEMNQDVITESINEMTKSFSELADISLEETQDAISEILAEITKVFEEFAGEISNEVVTQSDRNRNMLEEIIIFFTKDDWSFTKLQGESVLQTAFQGQNGKWNCYAKAREEENQFVFYSICPVNAPENKRLAIAEFITRANYGTIIGNFEFDYTDGEIRYKTSIDVEGFNLTFSLIKQLVYTNVTMMDEYLPGIVSVIEGDVAPKDAIAQIES